MIRLCALRRSWLFASILVAAAPVSVLAAGPPGEPAPPVSYAPADQYPQDEAQCKARLEKELPVAARSEEYYRCKMDFARLEHDYPLTGNDLAKITRSNLQAADQEQLDQIYARLTAGAIPDGPYEVHLFRPRDFGPSLQIAQMLAGERLKGLALLLSKPKEQREELVRQLWRGKVFDKSQRIVRTKIGDLAKLSSLISPKREEGVTTKQSPGAAQEPLLFPAKVYCGQSLLDGRREAIVIDYAYSHEIPGYVKEIDWLTGPQGLQVRDELRMVRPGLYLGRVYMGRMFFMNMILYKEDLARQNPSSTDQDCWVGTQRIAGGAR
ncbi:MAG: hypothetical protein AB1411_04970 [Nitrospirota bacterium]